MKIMRFLENAIFFWFGLIISNLLFHFKFENEYFKEELIITLFFLLSFKIFIIFINSYIVRRKKND
jgi:uncharacterized membrane protein YsdA (DUF1294 family)